MNKKPTRFGLVKATDRKAELADLPDFDAALRAVGLAPGHVDHGSLSPWLAYAVDEFGLFVPPEEQSYFALPGGALGAGNAVLYAVGDRGETVDLLQLPPLRFYGRGRLEVERAITRCEVARPVMSVNGVVLWKWPEPRQI